MEMDWPSTFRADLSNVILVGDAYEDHWLEVISVHDGSAKTIFSGLGYYLQGFVAATVTAMLPSPAPAKVRGTRS
jgi:hypothetical protein